ncbi:MAG: hypothetical protein KDC48_04460 [Planctomycetes bacterium]|nr:hypothetical protein [Planctomycetota bacterium]
MSILRLATFATTFLSALAAQRQADADLFTRLHRQAADAPLVVGHRGASAECPENTVASFRRAVAAGAHMVEFDVYQSKDGKWVCMHDATCDRTTDAVARLGRKNVRVDALDLGELRSLDAGGWRDARFVGERVPTLEEALAAIFPAVPMIERKGGDAAALVDELRRLRVVDRVLVQAFDWDWLEQVHRAEPALLLGALAGKQPTAELLADLPRTGARLVHWDHRSLDLQTALAIRAKGQLLCVYTVDPDIALLGAARLGCDLVTTNVPARMAALRDAGQLRRDR